MSDASVKARLSALVDDFFAEGGYLEQQGFSYRAEQERYAKVMVRWLTEAAYPVGVEAGTGIGKTMAYLLPIAAHAAITGERAVISTPTVSLIMQIQHKEWLVVDAFLKSQDLQGLRLGWRLGAQQFCCRERAYEAIETWDYDKANADYSDQYALLNALQKWVAGIGRTHQGLIPKFVEEYGQLPTGIDKRSICLNESSDRQQYTAHKEAAKTASLVLTTHTSIALECLKAGSMLGLRPHTFFFDEAEQFSEAAKSVLTRRFQPNSLDGILKRLLNGCKRVTPKLKDAALELAELGSLLDAKLRDIRPGAAAAYVLDDLDKQAQEQAVSDFSTIAEQASGLLLRIDNTKHKTDQIYRPPFLKARNALEQMISAIQQMARSREYTRSGSALLCVHYSDVKGIPSLAQVPAGPGGIMAFLLSAPRYHGTVAGEEDQANFKPPRIALTSATLSTASKEGGLTIKLTDYGFSEERTSFTERIEAARFGHLDFVLSNPSIPVPFDSEEDDEGVLNHFLNPVWLDHAADMIKMAAQQGNVLVLTNSYAETKALAIRLGDDRVHEQSMGRSLSETLAAARKTGGVLLSPVAWSGENLRHADGSALFTQLVITRIPRAPADDIQVWALYHHYKKRNSSFTFQQASSMAYGKSINNAFKKLRQQLGRPIRQPDDRATVWIADSRFPIHGVTAAKSYELFRYAIPARFQDQWAEANVYPALSSTTQEQQAHAHA